MEKEPIYNRKETMRISNIGIVELNGMSFRAYHGCLESERKNGNDFTVNFTGLYDISKAAESDSLDDAVDYGRVYDIIAEQMAIPSNLLEHVAARCVDAIKAEFPQLHDCSIRITKHNPPVNGPADNSTVIIRG